MDLGRNRDGILVGGKLDGIRKQVVEHLHETVTVGPNLLIGDLSKLQMDIEGIGERLDAPQSFLEQRSGIDRLISVDDLASGKLLEVQQVIDQLE